MVDVITMAMIRTRFRRHGGRWFGYDKTMHVQQHRLSRDEENITKKKSGSRGHTVRSSCFVFFLFDISVSLRKIVNKLYQAGL
mmetsp:Transcript_35466/g.38386  ORF Transcript_35466/g.38386 Transcript_35466/m.38386 type:complete len:83 (+) Transcript_35466:356-604(+)